MEAVTTVCRVLLLYVEFFVLKWSVRPQVTAFYLDFIIRFFAIIFLLLFANVLYGK